MVEFLSMLNFMLIIKDFLTWPLIGWQLCCQPIRCQLWKSLLTKMDLTWKFLSNPGPWMTSNKWCQVMKRNHKPDWFISTYLFQLQYPCLWKRFKSTHLLICRLSKKNIVWKTKEIWWYMYMQLQHWKLPQKINKNWYMGLHCTE